MRAIQQAFLELCSQGLSKNVACRRLGISRSSPGYWAQTQPEFDAAFKPYRGHVYKLHDIKPDLVKELAEHLIADGHVDVDDRDDVCASVARFCMRTGLLRYKEIRPLVNHDVPSLAEKRQIVDAYLKLKGSKSGTTHNLHLFLVEHRVTHDQVGRWAKRLYGQDALRVGPYQPGRTRDSILDCVKKMHRRSGSPVHPVDVISEMGINEHSVRAYLVRLGNEGRIRRVAHAGKVYYAPA